MAEKRKPILIILLRNLSKENKKKSSKVEFFPSSQFIKAPFRAGRFSHNQYRLRVNGKWFNTKDGKRTFFTKTEAKNILFKSIKL